MELEGSCVAKGQLINSKRPRSANSFSSVFVHMSKSRGRDSDFSDEENAQKKEEETRRQKKSANWMREKKA